MEEQIFRQETPVIHFDNKGKYIDILGHRIDKSYESFEAFVEELKELTILKEKITNTTLCEIKGIGARELYEVLCRDLSFNSMIELYRLIDHKMKFLDDEVYDYACMKGEE